MLNSNANRLTIMMALSRAISLLVQSDYLANVNPAIKVFYKATNPVPVPGRANTFVSLVAKLDVNTRSIVPELVLGSSVQEITGALNKYNTFNSHMSFATDDSYKTNVMESYVILTGQSITNMADLVVTSAQTLMSVIVGEVIQAIDSLIQSAPNIDMLYFAQVAHQNCLQSGREYNFYLSGLIVTLNQVRRDPNNQMIFDYDVNLGLEVLRSAKNDNVFGMK